ncbi:7453_t:CDS:2 [Funneliformis geosporum]|uniref:17531_t:CDS:1 n=1 Tax=Funneliformis geosporum TaxID=1117311 RepID=A0A9W4SCE0_9GLOM|nr:7453_t:CDS:2 [Funneliformis geosporum]CAI2163751.1 17531_t:CDS:2 [Funneliformis geosporum]
MAENLPKVGSLLEAASAVGQNFDPVNKIHEHVCGFHFYSHDMSRQVEAHHYCSHLKDEVRQCVIYDSNRPDARLIGVEYIISARLFQSLPEEEKIYWHSHVYEVKSGMLICPFIPVVPQAVVDKAEKVVMEELIDTYGKTWHFWQVDRGDPLPYGPPQLMMAFLDDFQLSQKILDDRDKRFNISTSHYRKNREGIHPKYNRDLKADHWASRDDNMAYQTEMKLVEQKSLPTKEQRNVQK